MKVLVAWKDRYFRRQKIMKENFHGENRAEKQWILRLPSKNFQVIQIQFALQEGAVKPNQ